MEIESIISKWQKIFGLSNWKIGFKFVEFERTDGFPQKGDIKVDTAKKTATILLKNNLPNAEHTIIHELTHLLIWDLDHFAEAKLSKEDKEKYFDLLESTVANLTEIFYSAKLSDENNYD